MRKVSSIVGLSVIASADGVNMGTVTEVVVDLAKGAIVGLVVGAPPTERGVMAEDIAVIGPDAIMVGDRSKMRPMVDMPDLVGKRRPSREKPTAVITKSGTKLGVLAEVYVDPSSHEVTRYEVSGGPVRDLTDGTLALPVVGNMVHGPDTVIVPDAVIVALDEKVGGMKGAWAGVSRALRKDLHRASEKAAEMYQRSSEGVKQAVEQAKQKSQEVSKTVAEKVEQSRKSSEDEQATEQSACESAPQETVEEPELEPEQTPEQAQQDSDGKQDDTAGQ